MLVPKTLDELPRDLYTTPIDGNDPKVLSNTIKLPPFSFMSIEVYEMYKYSPEVPPPTYDKYDAVIKPKPGSNELAYILHGWEKLESGTMKCID